MQKARPYVQTWSNGSENEPHPEFIQSVPLVNLFMQDPHASPGDPVT
jgi:hypothetical protein